MNELVLINIRCTNCTNNSDSGATGSHRPGDCWKLSVILRYEERTVEEAIILFLHGYAGTGDTGMYNVSLSLIQYKIFIGNNIFLSQKIL